MTWRSPSEGAAIPTGAWQALFLQRGRLLGLMAQETLALVPSTGRGRGLHLLLQGPQHLEQQSEVERLSKEMIEATHRCCLAIRLPGPACRGHEQYPPVNVEPANLPRYVEAVSAGKVNVQQHGIGIQSLHRRQSMKAVVDRMHFMVFCPQKYGDGFGVVAVVVHDQYLRAGSCPETSIDSRRRVNGLHSSHFWSPRAMPIINAHRLSIRSQRLGGAVLCTGGLLSVEPFLHGFLSAS